MTMEKLVFFLAVFLFMLLFGALIAWGVQIAWNAVIPALFRLREIDYGQAYALYFLVSVVGMTFLRPPQNTEKHR